MKNITEQLLKIASLLNDQQEVDVQKDLKGDFSKLKSKGNKNLKAILKDKQACERLNQSNPSVEITAQTKLSQLTVEDLQKILACIVD